MSNNFITITLPAKQLGIIAGQIDTDLKHGDPVERDKLKEAIDNLTVQVTVMDRFIIPTMRTDVLAKIPSLPLHHSLDILTKAMTLLASTDTGPHAPDFRGACLCGQCVYRTQVQNLFRELEQQFAQ